MEDGALVHEGKVHVVVDLTVLSSSQIWAQVHEVWSELGHLPRVDVVVKWEWSIGDSHLVLDSAAIEWLSQEVTNHWQDGERVRAQKVVEKLKVDLSCSTSDSPSWLSTVKRSAVGID